MNEKTTEVKLSVELKAKPSVVVRLALLQIVVAVAFSVTLAICFGRFEALSALLGGMIAALANFFFAGRLFVTRTDLDANQILKRFYRSVSMKVLFTLTMFAICMIVMKVSILPFIIAYFLAAVITNWLYLLVA